jgi:hypothetical protein
MHPAAALDGVRKVHMPRLLRQEIAPLIAGAPFQPGRRRPRLRCPLPFFLPFFLTRLSAVSASEQMVPARNSTMAMLMRLNRETAARVRGMSMGRITPHTSKATCAQCRAQCSAQCSAGD